MVTRFQNHMPISRHSMTDRQHTDQPTNHVITGLAPIIGVTGALYHTCRRSESATQQSVRSGLSGRTGQSARLPVEVVHGIR